MENKARKKILLTFLESLPFLKTGGCADVIGGIIRYINKSRFECRMIMPDFIFNRDNIRMAEHLMYVDVEFEGKQYTVELKTAIAYESVFYFIRCDEVFSNDVMFTQDEAQITRYRFFQYALLECIKAVGYKPDIIHGHDWESGLQAKLIREPRFREFFGSSRTLLCIHNIIWQGNGDLATGIRYSDAVMTVSETYRKEVMTPEYGAGLHEILLKRQETFYSIQDGVDFCEFDPATDNTIAANYDNPQGKKANKLYFQRSQGLEERENCFLIGMVCRLYSYKGIDLVIEAFDEIMKMPDIQMAFLGDGPENYEPVIEELARRYPGRVAALTFFDGNEIMRSVYAGADAYLMPSKTEPCGISQMIAMRYGTVPIVRRTGGLRDTVIPYGEKGCTGFAFEKYDAGEMLKAIKHAASVYYCDRNEWDRIAIRDMEMDFSWEDIVKEYENLYEKIILF